MIVCFVRSLGYITEHMDPINGLAPLFEAELELLEPDLVFTPSLEYDDKGGFHKLIDDLITDILDIASHFPRISSRRQTTYLDDILANPDIADMKMDILSNVQNVAKQALNFCDNFQAYSYFWYDDRKVYLDNFLRYSRQLTPEEMELVENNDSAAPKLCKPKMENFREQVSRY